MKSSSKDKRQFIRVPLLSESAEIFLEGKTQEVYSLADLSQKGLFAKSDVIPKLGSSAIVYFTLPGDLGTLPIMGKIARVVWTQTKKDKDKKVKPKGFAVEFDEQAESTKKILDAYIVYLRNKQIISVSKRILEEFFKGGPGI